MDDFEKVKLIGRGAYGEVQLVSPGELLLFAISFFFFFFGILTTTRSEDSPKVRPLGNNAGDH